jgi:hypothetical protein
MQDSSVVAERMIRRRALGAVVLAILLIASQGSRMGGGETLWSWGLWAAAVLAFVLWASGAFRGRATKSLLNDESSEDNRRRALICGFWVALASAAICFGLTFVKDYGPRDAIQVIVTAGVAAALLNFGAAERRGLAA